MANTHPHPVLENGEIATAPLRTAKQTDHLVLSGNSTQTWEPTFTYHGFRYVQVDGWPTAQTPLNKDTVKAIVVHSDMQRTGEFETSNSLLNRLVQNILWSCEFVSSLCYTVILDHSEVPGLVRIQIVCVID